jgi:predicted nucleic acid-binding protein
VLAGDPDNRILECALAGDAKAIVTGDREMLARNTFRGIRVISLREFLESG